MTPADAPPQHLIERSVKFIQPGRTGASTTAPVEPRVVSLKLRSPAADWLRSAVTEISELTALRPGWDSYSAAAIAAGCATRAVEFLLDNAYPELAPPAIVPLVDGGIQVEWHRRGLDVEIAFSGDEPGVFVVDAETGETEEAPLDQAGAYVSRLISRLSA